MNNNECSENISRINDALERGEFICFFCNCNISYSGRAESYLDDGDRFIAIKQDKTVMIHQPEGGMPINYVKAPASCELLYQEEEGVPFILFQATSGDDEVVCAISEVYEVYTRRLIDGQKQDLSGKESEMSDMIRDNPECIGNDFIPLSREEHTKYGFIDVFGHLGDGTLAVVECKRYTAGLSAVSQLRRYVEKMQKAKGIEKVIGILAAPAITSNAQQMLADWGFRFCAVDPPKQKMRKRREQKKIDQFFS
jgi:RecB family endonuclease NucS